MTKPKKCYCGGNAEVGVLWDSKTGTKYYVKCEDCDKSTRLKDSEEEAVKEWNEC